VESGLAGPYIPPPHEVRTRERNPTVKKRQEQLIQAITKNDAFRVQALLTEEPSLLRSRDTEGRTPMLLALYFGHEDLARVIRDRVEEVDVFEAAALGDVAALRTILEASEEAANARSPDGFGPLGLAAFFGRYEAAEILLRAGANPNTPASNPFKVSPIHSAAAHRDAQRSLKVCRLLLDHGADPNVKQAGGWTPLHQAAAHGRREVVELLLAHGAATEALSDDDRTPSQMAEVKGHSEIQALIEASGA